MYTQCLHCRTIFAIGAETIRAGRGTARCGHCLQEFDALETLSDTLTERLAEKVGRSAEKGYLPRSASMDSSAGAVQKRAAAGEGAEAVQLPNATPAKRRRDVIEEQTDAAPPPVATQDRFPEVLREELEAAAVGKVRATRRVAFGAGSAVLMALLAAQAMWFASETLSERYPTLLPVLMSFCQYTGCELAKRRDPTQIQMISRDVRIHPDYEGALRVVATVVNRLPYAQPYPRMQFTLFNVNGEVIVGRTFRPDEYLASEVDVTAGMLSLEPVQIVLDLMALEQAAVSFEFRFL